MLDWNKDAQMESSKALMTTKWTCQKCGKRSTLMMMKASDYDKVHRVACGRCFKLHLIKHHQVIKIGANKSRMTPLRT